MTATQTAAKVPSMNTLPADAFDTVPSMNALSWPIGDDHTLQTCTLGKPYGEITAGAHVGNVFAAMAGGNGATEFYRIVGYTRRAAVVRRVTPRA